MCHDTPWFVCEFKFLLNARGPGDEVWLIRRQIHSRKIGDYHSFNIIELA
jgi:hypothetical protein